MGRIGKLAIILCSLALTFASFDLSAITVERCRGTLHMVQVSGSEVVIYFDKDGDPTTFDSCRCKVSTVDENKYGSTILEMIQLGATANRGNPVLQTQTCEDMSYGGSFTEYTVWCGWVQVYTIKPNF
jgi:hypothetical protein